MVVKEKNVKYLTKILWDVVQEDDQKTDGVFVYKQILINAKLQIGNRDKKTELTERSPLTKRRSTLDSSAIEGGGGGEEEEVYLHGQETKSHSCNKLTTRPEMYANGQKCALISCSP